MPPVPAPCGGNVRPVAVGRPETVNLRARPWVPAPCGGNVGSVQPKAAPWSPAAPPAPAAQPKPVPWSPASPPQPAFVAQAKPALQSIVQRARAAAGAGAGAAPKKAKGGAKTVTKGKAKGIEDALLLEIDEAYEAGDIKRAEALEKAFNGFEVGSGGHEVKVALAAAGASSATTKMLDWGSVRAANYPSGYDKAANDARDAYVNANKKPGDATKFLCPGKKPPSTRHWAAVSDATIDHKEPVAQHWNRIGHDQSRAQRNAWYSDTKNHAYVCQSCNSSMGSGGVTYGTPPGPNYSS